LYREATFPGGLHAPHKIHHNLHFYQLQVERLLPVVQPFHLPFRLRAQFLLLLHLPLPFSVYPVFLFVHPLWDHRRFHSQFRQELPEEYLIHHLKSV